MNQLIPIAIILNATAYAGGAPQSTDRGAASRQEFDRRISDYVKLHKAIQSRLQGLRPTNSPAAIEHREAALGREIRSARRGTARGSIFTPAISAQFRLLIRETMRGPDAGRIWESLKQAEPVNLPSIHVNTVYPAGLPLQSTPPSLLLKLPVLPNVLEYRVVKRSLILRDIEANLIVDYIPNAIP